MTELLLHPIRSAMAVAGMAGNYSSRARACGFIAFTIDPVPSRRYSGGSSAASARLTEFFERRPSAERSP
jgi:hypothetical protein